MLVALANVGSPQPSLFPDHTVSPDELALGFDHWASVVRTQYADNLTPPQIAALSAVHRQLATMSHDQAEFDLDFWTEAAAAGSEQWAAVRELANAALEAFEWTTGDGTR